MNSRKIVSELKTLVGEERKILIQITKLLREVERLRIFAELGYSSLFEFCTRELKYSDGAAYRRIQAMRAIKDIPEVAEAISEGKLTLTTVCAIQKSMKMAPLEQKKALFQKMENLSSRECERTLAALFPIQAQEKTKPINGTEIQIQFVVNESLNEKFETLKALMGCESYAVLFEKLAEIALKKLESNPKKDDKAQTASNANFTIFLTSAPKLKRQLKNPTTRYVRIRTKATVQKRDGTRCCYLDPHTQRRCESRYKLQLDHIHPYALGGQSTAENLRLLCPAHNQLMAIRQFGQKKMATYISSLRE